MILIGISGKKGTGKDLLSSYLKNKYGFTQMPFAEELKASVRRDFNFTKEQTDGKLKEAPTEYLKGFKLDAFRPYWTPREIMVEYGQFFRMFDKNWWVKKVFTKINQSFDKSLRVVISDVRFKNEADYIRAQGGYIVRLERRQDLNIYKENSNDISETELDRYEKFDLILNKENNLFPEDLERFAEKIMSNIQVSN